MRTLPARFPVGITGRRVLTRCAVLGVPLAAAPLEQADRPRTPSPSAHPRRRPEGERKTVTALFADIKGSTELMRDLDPEEARAIVDPVLQLMMAAVHRYGGYVAQSTGDGIFALVRRARRA